MIYFIIYFAISLIGLGIAAGAHGEDRPPTNFWTKLAAFLLGNGLILAGLFQLGAI